MWILTTDRGGHELSKKKKGVKGGVCDLSPVKKGGRDLSAVKKTF